MGEIEKINLLKIIFMLDLTPVLILGVIFGFIFAVVYIQVRKKERLAMLEKGADPSMFHVEPRPGSYLKYGIFLVGIAVGILLGNVLEVFTALNPVVSYFSMIFMFGGLGLIISHVIERKK
jgi:hypothetical protein